MRKGERSGSGRGRRVQIQFVEVRSRMNVTETNTKDCLRNGVCCLKGRWNESCGLTSQKPVKRVYLQIKCNRQTPGETRGGRGGKGRDPPRGVWRGNSEVEIHGRMTEQLKFKVEKSSTKSFSRQCRRRKQQQGGGEREGRSAPCL